MAKVANGNGRAPTVDAWGRASEKLTEIAKKNSVFIRLEDDGDKVVGAFVGDPRVRECHWTGTEYKDCDGEECKLCDASIKVSAKVMLNFFVRDDAAMRVFEGGSAWFRGVCKVRDKYGLDTWWFEVERHGAAKDPKTTYSILPDAQITDEDLAAIHGAVQHDLYDLGGQDFPSDTAPAPPRQPATRPAKAPNRPEPPPGSRRPAAAPAKPPAPPTVELVSDDQARWLIEQLKSMPEDTLSRFLATYELRRVRDLKAELYDDAVAWLEDEARKLNPQPEDEPAAAEFDPWA